MSLQEQNAQYLGGSTGSSCMFPKRGFPSSIDLATSGAAQPRSLRPAADRSPRGTTKAGEKQDRRRLPTPSPNSRQSRAPRNSASSHPQDRACVMEGTPDSVRTRDAKSPLSTCGKFATLPRPWDAGQKRIASTPKCWLCSPRRSSRGRARNARKRGATKWPVK